MPHAPPIFLLVALLAVSSVAALNAQRLKSPPPSLPGTRRLSSSPASALANSTALLALAANMSVHLDERYAFDGSHSDFAQQFFRLYLSAGGDASASLSSSLSGVAAPPAAQVPPEVAAYVREGFGLAFSSLPPLLQLAAVWDGGFVAAAALGFVRVRVRCGLRMSELALSLAAYRGAGCVEQPCASPAGERFSQSLYCNGDQVARVAQCAAKDGVAPVHAPMWSDGGAEDALPVAEVAKHQWQDGNRSFTVFAVHLAGDPNTYGKCALPSMTVPCVPDDGSERWCAPRRGRIVAEWLAHEQRRQAARLQPSAGQQVAALGAGGGSGWGGATSAFVAAAAAAAVLLGVAIAALVVWKRAPRGRKCAILGDDLAGSESWSDGGERDACDQNGGRLRRVDFALDQSTRRSRSFDVREAGRRPSPRSGRSQQLSISFASSTSMPFSPPASPPSSLRVISATPQPPEEPESLTKDSGRSHASSKRSVTSLEPTQRCGSLLDSAASIMITSNPALSESAQGPLEPDSALVALPEDPQVLALRVEPADVRRLSRLAVGAYGEIWLGRLRGELVAIKRLRDERRKRTRELEAFAAEILLMTRLAHPNVLALRGIAWTSLPSLSLIMEFMERGDLHRVLQKEGAWLTWSVAKAKLARDVARALAYLHSRGVVHRDLKSKNVLIGEELEAKLSDFGTSRHRSKRSAVTSSGREANYEARLCEMDLETAEEQVLDEEDLSMTAGVGTAYWTAPEVLAGGRYADKADVYSFGVVLSELDTCELPFSSGPLDYSRLAASMRPLQVLSLVLDGKLRPRFLPSCPEAIRTLAAACLNADVDARPTAVDLVETLDAFIDKQSS